MPAAQATHLRAGDIQAKVDTALSNPNFRKFYFKMILYQKNPAQGVPDETSVKIFFSDCSAPITVARASVAAVTPNTNRNTYFFEHTFNAPGTYTVSYIGENRNQGVLNMTGSVNQSFYISTTVTVDPGLGQNRSAVLTAPAVRNASVAQVFQHNPGAYDADGDSLAFELLPSRQVPGGATGPTAPCYTVTPVVTTGYTLPNNLGSGFSNGTQVTFAGPPVGQPGSQSIFVQDPITGTIVWNSPGTVGEYNVAFKVTEYRRTPFGRRKVGEVVRDMQILVDNTANQRPQLVIPADLCVVAGTPVQGTVTATDPDRNPVQINAYSGILPRPATFSQTLFGPPTASATFRWTPDCSNIASEPTQVTFEAVDQPAGPNPIPLTDLRVWRITVIGPAPQNVQVRQVTNSATANISWDRYACQNASRLLIFRKEGPGGSFGPCETGIPASAGYTQIASVSPTTTSYSDDRGGLGLERGKTYCYRIYAEFPLPAGGKSLASAEACITFPGRPTVFTNVTVDRTSTSNGQITVRWTKPTSTIPFNAPTIYRLLRAQGSGANTGTFTEIRRVTNNLNDTTYVDNDPALDTQNRSYTYKLEFISNTTSQPGSGTTTETPPTASSVRVDGTASPELTPPTITLRWTHYVPWDNSRRPTTIIRKGPNPTDPFVQIATVTGTPTGGTYTDRGTAAQPLVKGQTYCYYVSTNGTYSVSNLPDPLINLSQQQCIAVRAIPCPPVLTLKRTNCDSLASKLFDLPATPLEGQRYTNNLSWTLGNTPTDCSREIASYNIYYSSNSQDSLRFLTTVPGTQTTYQHQNLASEAGCYAVQAVDVSGNRSVFSNKECKDDCVLFLLPNVFTPNGDSKNDVFRPKVFTPVRKTTFRVFNRWGVKIYESNKEPLIKWDGGGSRTEGGAAPTVTEGMYFYQAEVEFADANNTKRTYKGWVEIAR